MSKINFNNPEPVTIPAPTKPDTAPTVTPDTKPGNDPWNVPNPNVSPTPKAFFVPNP